MDNLFAGPANSLASTEAAMRQLGAMAVDFAISFAGALLLLIFGLILAGLFQHWSYTALGRFRGFDETLRRFFSQAVRYAVLIVTIVTVLAQFGVQTASIIAALGAAGLAIALALQGTLQNIASGIMLLVLRPFRVGETIQTGAIIGTIQEIGLFATELKTEDGLFVLAPNSELWKLPVVNFSRNGRRRNDLTFRLLAGEDRALVQDTLSSLAEGDGRVLKQPAPELLVANPGDGSAFVTLRYWTKTGDWWQTRLDLADAARQIFEKNGISAPFPR